MKKYGVNLSIDVIGTAVASQVSKIFRAPAFVSYDKEKTGTGE